MSADDGIYIGTFPTENGEIEYRVSHAQNIGDCDTCDCGDPKCARTSEVVDHNRLMTYIDAKVFTDHDQAVLYAYSVAKKMYEEDEAPEYGVCSIAYERPILKKSFEEALEWLEAYWTKLNEETE